ncbi:MAG: extracellular solute-binding protein [Rhizobiales bacterium]|nr:extracellular solute-binding protein [Hyphomicrobiales bacterium]
MGGNNNISRRLFLGGMATAGLSAGLIARIQTVYAQNFTGQLSLLCDAAKRAALQKAVDKFAALNPGLEIRLNAASVDQLMATVRMQYTSGTAPDIVPVWPGSGVPLSVHQVAPGGFLADLSGQPIAKMVPEFAKDVIEVDGKLYWYANQPSVIGGITNMRVIQKAGIKQPKTWTEFLDACQKLKDQGIIPIALGNATQWITQLISYALVATTVFADNPAFPEDMKAGKATFVGSGWEEALGKYVELNKRGFFNDNPSGTSFEESQQLVASEQAAMAIHTAGTMAGMIKTAGHREFEMWPIPARDDPEQTRVPVGITNGYGVFNGSKNKDAAIAFLNFMNEPEIQRDWADVTLVPVFGMPPEMTDPVYVGIMSYVNAGKGALYMDNKWPNPRVQEAHFVGIPDLLDGRATIQDVLGRMDAAYKS